MRLLLFFASLFFSFLGQAQKTYFLETERNKQQVFIDGNQWDQSAFFTVNPSTGYHQVIIKEKGYKNNFDILKEGIHTIFSTTQKIEVDTIILSKVKPIDLSFAEDYALHTFDVDYVSYMKDVNYNGKIGDGYKTSAIKTKLESAVNPSVRYLINELNEYHNMTRGRYAFYSLANVREIELYVVSLEDGSQFIEAYANVDWSITSKNTENLPQYNHEGFSGKFIFDSNKKTYNSAVNAAIHDALFSSLLTFLADQEYKLSKSLSN